MNDALVKTLQSAASTGLTLGDADMLATYLRHTQFHVQLMQDAVDAHARGELLVDLNQPQHRGDHTELVHALWRAERRGLTLADDAAQVAEIIETSGYLTDARNAAVQANLAAPRLTPPPAPHSPSALEQHAALVMAQALESVCPHCLRPQATEEDWRWLEPGEGPHLCWEEPNACHLEPSTTVTKLLARVLTEHGLLNPDATLTAANAAAGTISATADQT